MGDDIEKLAAGLNVALGRVVRRLRQMHVPGELTLSEASVLARLEGESPATPGELAVGERVKPQAMGVTLGALESRGLVARRADPDDGRRVLMSITPAGRALVGHRRGAKITAMGAALGDFTAAERARLADATELLNRLADRL